MNLSVSALLMAGIIVLAQTFTLANAGEGESPPAYGVEAPLMTDKTFRTPLPKPYDDARDATKDIETALSEAKRDEKFVLVTFGANWCPDCRALAAMMQMPEFQKFMQDHFVQVYVDVGRYDRNLDVAEAIGVTDGKGVPTVVVLTSSGKMLNKATSSAWITSQGRDPQAALNYFAAYAPIKDGDVPLN